CASSSRWARRPRSSSPSAVNIADPPASFASWTAATAPAPPGASQVSAAWTISPAAGTRSTRANSTHSTCPMTATRTSELYRARRVRRPDPVWCRIRGDMAWYADTVKRLGHARWFAWFGSRVAPPVDRALYRLTGGKVLSTGKPILPTLLLTTTGRRSGRERTTPLLFIRDGERLVIAGSNWGRPGHPAWALNLQANPRARVQIGRDVRGYRARDATEDEREALWPK